MPAPGTPRGRRNLRIATVGAAIAAIAAVCIPTVMGAADDAASAHALGERTPVAALTTAPAAPPPVGLRVLAGETGEADLATTRVLGAARGQAFYALGSLKDPGRVCVAATGAAVGLWCGPAAAVGTGKLIVRQPLEGGAPGSPAVYFGLVPDGVVSVSAGGHVVPVSGNVFSIYDEAGRALPRLTYTTADGASVTVDPLSAD
jgi:hypothetical protein